MEILLLSALIDLHGNVLPHGREMQPLHVRPSYPGIRALPDEISRSLRDDRVCTHVAFPWLKSRRQRHEHRSFNHSILRGRRNDKLPLRQHGVAKEAMSAHPAAQGGSEHTGPHYGLIPSLPLQLLHGRVELLRL